MRMIAIAGLLIGASSTGALSQAVPDGVHKDVTGPSAVCGVTGRNALDFISKISASKNHRRVSQTDRFEFYLSADGMDAWVFTRPTEAAHPAITCRHLFRDAGGSLYLTRDMRCDSGREACDKLYLEFTDLDEQIKEGFDRQSKD